MRPASARAADVELRSAETLQFARDVREGLCRRPRELPPRYFYDALGSALFEAICELPWYRVTRAEIGLITTHGRQVLAAPCSEIVELGSGSGQKLAALLADGPPAPMRVHLIDVSPAALKTATAALDALDRNLEVVAHHAEYGAGLDAFARARQRGGRRLALFLGSNVGNFDPPEVDRLLRRIAEALAPGDALLLGVDLVKPERDLLLAYDDPLGVTAAFNRNMLARINRELDGDIDLAGFRHRAVWNQSASRVEMHLVSTRPQRVRVRAAGIDQTIQEGETICSERSYKFRADDVPALLRRAGFRQDRIWIDDEAQFALVLAGRS